MKKINLLFAIIPLLLFSGLSMADEDRYQAVILQQGGTGSERQQGKVFIIDSKLGHIWTWEDKSKFTTEDGKMAFGTKLTYQGKTIFGKIVMVRIMNSPHFPKQ